MPATCGSSGQGQFAEIRFEAADVAGLPAAVRQDSWNLMVFRPAGFHARVAGRWYDDAGQPSGQAALLLSDRGAVLTHIVLPEDREGKKQMLAAVLGYLSPPLWRRMAAAELDRAGRAGQCGSFAETAAFVRAGRDNAAELLSATAGITLAGARRDFALGRFVEAAAGARRGHQQLVEAYLRAQPSRTREARAVWNHSGAGAYPGDWDRSARELARNGLNMIFPNMLWGGLAHYPSDVLPRSDIFRKYGDQVAQCVAAAKRHGLEVHVWKVHFNLAGAPPEFVAQDAPGGSHAGLPARPAGGLAVPFAPRKPPAGSPEHGGGRPPLPGRRLAHGLHPLSGRPVLLLRRLSAAVRGRLGPPGEQLAGRLRHGGPQGRVQRLAHAARSRSWWPTSIAR